MQSQYMLPEDAITSFSWYMYADSLPRFSFDGETCPFKHFIRLLIYCIKMIKLFSIVQRSCLKGSYSSENVDLDPLFIYDDAISLFSDQFYWKLS